MVLRKIVRPICFVAMRGCVVYVVWIWVYVAVVYITFIVAVLVQML